MPLWHKWLTNSVLHSWKRNNWPAGSANDWVSPYGEHLINGIEVKTTRLFNITYETPDFLTLDANGINNTISVSQEKLTPGNTHDDYRTHETNDFPGMEQSQTEDRTNNINAKILCWFPVQRIMQNIKIVNRTRYGHSWYFYKPDKNTVEPPDHILQHFDAPYWSWLNERTLRIRRN